MSVNYNPKTATDGLVFYVDAANTKSYSGSGSTWSNIVGSTNLTLFNSPTFLSQSFQFRQASNQYGSTTIDSGILKASNEIGQWSLEACFKYISNGNPEAVVIGRSGCHGGIYLWNDNSIYCAIKTTSCWTGALNVKIENVSAGNIYHVVFTYNNTQCKFYVNGRPATILSSTTFDGATYNIYNYGDTLFVGGIPPIYTPNIDLYLAKAYTREISAAEVKQNFDATRGRFGI